MCVCVINCVVKQNPENNSEENGENYPKDDLFISSASGANSLPCFAFREVVLMGW